MNVLTFSYRYQSSKHSSSDIRYRLALSLSKLGIFVYERCLSLEPFSFSSGTFNFYEDFRFPKSEIFVAIFLTLDLEYLGEV